MKMKRVSVGVLDGNQSRKHPGAIKLKIHPGVRAKDILTHLNLGKDYVLVRFPNYREPFTEDDDVYGMVPTRARLIARLSPQALERYCNLRKVVEDDDDDIMKGLLTEEEFATIQREEDFE